MNEQEFLKVVQSYSEGDALAGMRLNSIKEPARFYEAMQRSFPQQLLLPYHPQITLAPQLLPLAALYESEGE